MRVSKITDSGDKHPLPFPTVIPETDIRLGRRYVLAMQFASGDGQLIGPFEIEQLPTEITRNYPMIGHFVLRTKASDTEASQRVFVPRSGMVYMCGIQYSLHEATEATIAYFRDAFRRSRDILIADRARFARYSKYAD